MAKSVSSKPLQSLVAAAACLALVAACACNKKTNTTTLASTSNKTPVEQSPNGPSETNAPRDEGPLEGDPQALSDQGDKTLPAGLSVSELGKFETKVFFRVLNNEPSACGKAHSLLTSLQKDPSCRKSFWAAKHVFRLVRDGYTDSEITEHLANRFMDEDTLDLALANSPFKGPAGARVTVVEFVDYQCPHCKAIQSVLHELMEAFPADVKVYFKHFPLSQHTNARQAALAATAAQRQGKFWAYSDRVWANSNQLTSAKLEQIAKDVGLDVQQWRQDIESNAVVGQVDNDKNLGQEIPIAATPAIFINGKAYKDNRDIEAMKEWVYEALGK